LNTHPSLNERRDDIIPIAKSFLLDFAKKHNKPISGIKKNVEKFLRTYQWAGNIRELKNMIERGVLIANGPELTLTDVNQGDGIKQSTPDFSINTETIDLPPIPEGGLSLEELTAHYFKEALKIAGGNEAKAAKLLKMPYYAFRYKRKKLFES
jgi:DNA-binding NtrC family response regulator